MIKEKLKLYRQNRLVKNFSYVIIARFSNAFLFFFVSILLMDFFSKEDYGRFNYFYSTVAIFTFLVNLGLDKSFVAATSKITNNQRFLNYVGLFWRLKLLIFGVITILLLVYYFLFGNFYYLIVALTGFTFGLSEGFKPLAESRKKFNVVSVLVPVRNLILIIALLFVQYFRRLNLDSLFIIFLGANVLNFILYFIVYEKKISHFTLKTTLKARYLLSFTKWLSVKELFNVTVANLEILVLGYLVDNDIVAGVELGVYAGAFTLCRILSVITNALTTVLLPEVASKTSKQSLKGFLHQLKRSVILLLPICLVFFFSMIFLTRLMFGDKYQASEPIFIFVIVGTVFAFYANNISLIFMRAKSLAFLGKFTIVKFVLGMILSVGLIPSMGAVGAGMSFLAVRLFDLIVVIFRSTMVLNNPQRQI